MPKTMIDDVAMYFQAHYLLWVVGRLEPEVCDELDAMTPPGGENWRHLIERMTPWPRRRLQRRFSDLCQTMSDDEALDILFNEFGFEKSEDL